MVPLVRKLAAAPCSAYPPCPCRALRRGFVAADGQVGYTLNGPWRSCNGVIRKKWARMMWRLFLPIWRWQAGLPLPHRIKPNQRLFLYCEVLEIQLPWLDNITQAKAPKRLPVVLTVSEVQSVLSRLTGVHALIASLLYGGGMRLMEAVRLRVKDVDFARREIVVREGKGFKDRVTMLPEAVIAALQAHLARVKALHDEDLAQGLGEVYLPFALDKL